MADQNTQEAALRDQFAMAALQQSIEQVRIHFAYANRDFAKECATRAYDIADAMMVVRDKNSR